MESEPMWTLWGKSPLPAQRRIEPTTLHHRTAHPTHCRLSSSGSAGSDPDSPALEADALPQGQKAPTEDGTQLQTTPWIMNRTVSNPPLKTLASDHQEYRISTTAVYHSLLGDVYNWRRLKGVPHCRGLSQGLAGSHWPSHQCKECQGCSRSGTTAKVRAFVCVCECACMCVCEDVFVCMTMDVHVCMCIMQLYILHDLYSTVTVLVVLNCAVQIQLCCCWGWSCHVQGFTVSRFRGGKPGERRTQALTVDA